VPHFAQGAPTSPALANLLACRLDVRLHGLARAAGARYTRYAADLTFSGDSGFGRGLGRIGAAVGRQAQVNSARGAKLRLVFERIDWG
jgi:hypothetical protein